jgi:hypothetical protein
MALLLNGSDDLNIATDVAALNDSLEAHAKTIDLFDRMRNEKRMTPELTRALLCRATDYLLDLKRYSDYFEVVQDIDAKLEESIHNFESGDGIDEMELAQPQEVAEALRESRRKSLVLENSSHYEALLGTNQLERAARLADRLISFCPTAYTYSALIGRAVRAGRDDVARALVERGLSSLPEKDKWHINRAAKKIPKPK